MTTESESQARAFSQGCDARIAGRGLHTNPLHPDRRLAAYWRMGWLDASNFWGSKASWPVKPLPPMEAGGCQRARLQERIA